MPSPHQGDGGWHGSEQQADVEVGPRLRPASHEWLGRMALPGAG